MRVVLVATFVLGAVSSALAQSKGESVGLEITPVRGDVYRLRAGPRDTVFQVTPQGIVLADPLDVAAARWLEKELAARFPRQVVRFVLHGTHRFDRAEGGVVFNRTAELIGHRNFKRAVTSARRSAPGPYQRVQDMESTFDARRTITLGGRTVQMVWVGHDESDATVLLFPAERLLFVADPPVRLSVPVDLSGARPGDVLAWADAVRALDFDDAVTGLGTRFTRADVSQLAAYLRVLVDSVARGVEAGDSIRTLQSKPILRGLQANPHYPGRGAHIATAYRNISLFRIDFSGAVTKRYLKPNPRFCQGFTSCSQERSVSLGMGSVAVTTPRFGIVGEFSVGGQTLRSRQDQAQLHEQGFAVRQTRTTVLARVTPRWLRQSALVAGVSSTVTDINGMTHNRERLRSAALYPGGRTLFAYRSTDWGFTVGADLAQAVTPRMKVVVPVRLTRSKTRPVGLLNDSLTDVQVGVALSVSALRWVD